MKRTILYMIEFILVVSFFSFNSPAEAAKFRIGIHRSVVGSWEVVAHRMGYFKKAGLDYTTQSFTQGKAIRNAVIQDDVDVGTAGFSPFVLAVSKGAKVTALGITANVCGITFIMVPANSKAKSLKDLKGATFASKMGTSTNFAILTYILPAHGLAQKDFNWLRTNTVERLAALKSGNAQVAEVQDPMAEIAVTRGSVRVLEDFCKYDRTRHAHIGNPRTLRNHPDLYEKYFQGWLQAHTLLKNNPEKYARVYLNELQEVGQKIDFKIILKVVKRLKSEPFITDEVKNYLNDMADKQVKKGWIRKHPDFTKSPSLDGSILQKVAKRMGFPTN